jgi:hypothetical protein
MKLIYLVGNGFWYIGTLCVKVKCQSTKIHSTPGIITDICEKMYFLMSDVCIRNGNANNIHE